MIILGIETSCDETAIAILEFKNRKVRILSDVVASQVKIHAKYGGVYPFLAKREHQCNLAPTLIKALKEARLLNPKLKTQNSKLQLKTQNLSKKIDFIAVTVGPGLEPCLWQGVNFAQDLAEKPKKPVIPINHIEAHILVNFLKFKILSTKSIFSAICLVVSGGHTQLILMKGIGKYKVIGETRDDAAGECFDKTARILGLGYPGGPAIAKMAKKNGQDPFLTQIGQERVLTNLIKLPRPMLNQKNYDFSFSGLKTAVLYDFQSRSPKERKGKKYLQAMAFEIQQAIIDVLINKTLKAAREYKVKSIILGGGVVANEELRKQFRKKIEKELPNIQYLTPDVQFCTDNAVMIALAAFFYKKEATKNWQKIKADANLNIG